MIPGYPPEMMGFQQPMMMPNGWVADPTSGIENIPMQAEDILPEEEAAEQISQVPEETVPE